MTDEKHVDCHELHRKSERSRELTWTAFGVVLLSWRVAFLMREQSVMNTVTASIVAVALIFQARSLWQTWRWTARLCPCGETPVRMSSSDSIHVRKVP